MVQYNFFAPLNRGTPQTKKAWLHLHSKTKGNKPWTIDHCCRVRTIQSNRGESFSNWFVYVCISNRFLSKVVTFDAMPHVHTNVEFHWGKKKETQFLRRRRAGTCEGQILYPESDDNLGNFFFRGCGKEFNLTLTALPSPSFIVVVVVFLRMFFFPKMFLSFEWRRLTAASFITLCVRTRFYICVI